MPRTSINLRTLTAAHWLLFALVALSGTVDMLRAISLGTVTALGGMTLLAGGLGWGLWLLKPYLPRGLMMAVLPLVMFEIYATGSLLWYSVSPNALQLLAVGLAFVALVLLTARETEKDSRLAVQLQTGLLWSSVFSVAVYCLALFRGDADDTARAFALYAMVPVAICVARWRTGSPRYLVWGGLIVLAVFLSLSRTALVACLFLFPMGVALRGNRKSLTFAGIMLAAATTGFFVLILTYQPLYERFFAYDASMKVGDVSVNSSGRTKMWNALLDSLGDDWVFGKGISSSEALIADRFPLMGHPHNDFLRFYYDLGVFGLAMWIIFIGGFVATTAESLRRSIRHKTGDYHLHIAALLALTAVTGSMFTDNSISYSFVMMPLGLVLGCSLGVGRTALKLPATAARGVPVVMARRQPENVLPSGNRSISPL